MLFVILDVQVSKFPLKVEAATFRPGSSILLFVVSLAVNAFYFLEIVTQITHF